MAAIEVFIENPAGSWVKHHHNEETLEFLRVEPVRRPYPFPYGFVPGTRAPDGDCADCFVITGRPLARADTVEVEPIALMEWTEAGAGDHKVIAVLPGDPIPDLGQLQPTLIDFAKQVFAHLPGREVRAGRFLPAEDALAYLAACSPPVP